MSDDAVLRLLSRLPPATPDASRSERARARCHAVLTRRQRREARFRSRGGPLRRLIEPVLVGGFCLCYVTAVVVDVLISKGIL